MPNSTTSQERLDLNKNKLINSFSIRQTCDLLISQNPHAKAVAEEFSVHASQFDNTHGLDKDFVQLMYLIQAVATSRVFTLQKDPKFENKTPTWVLENRMIREMIGEIPCLDKILKQKLNRFLCDRSFEHATQHHLNNTTALYQHMAKASIELAQTHCKPNSPIPDSEIFAVCKQLALAREIVKQSVKINSENNTNIFTTHLPTIQSTWLKANENTLLSIEKNLDAVYRGHKVLYKNLMAMYKNADNTKAIASMDLSFFANLENVLKYSRIQHVKMLEDFKYNGTQNRAHYKAIQKSIRDILLTFVHIAFKENNEQENIKNIQAYEKELFSNSLGRCSYGSNTITRLIAGNRDRLAKFNLKDLSRLQALQDELQHFRRSYLVRHSAHKIQSKIVQNVNDANEYQKTNPDKKPIIDSNYNTNLSDQEAKLLQATAYHGTNSNILANLDQSDLYIMPSGKLQRLNITPYSGELSNGSGDGGINNHATSTVPLSDVKRAIHYTKDYYFKHDQLKANIQQSIACLQKLAQRPQIFKNIQDLTIKLSDGPAWCFIVKTLDRAVTLQHNLNIFDKAEWEAIINKTLPAIVSKLSADLKAFEQTQAFKNHMPKSLDLDGTKGYQHHDHTYWNESYIPVKGAIESLQKILNTPPLKLAKSQIELLLEEPTGLLIASDHYAQGLGDPSKSERVIHSDIRMGTDIKDVFVENANTSKINQHFKNNGIENVKIHDLESLTHLKQHETALAPYFADVLSKSKLNKILTLENTRPLHTVNAASRKLSKPQRFWTNNSALAKIRAQHSALKQFLNFKLTSYMMLSLLCLGGAFISAAVYASAIALTVTTLMGLGSIYKAYQQNKTNKNILSSIEHYIEQKPISCETTQEQSAYKAGLNSNSLVASAKALFTPATYSPQYYLGRQAVQLSPRLQKLLDMQSLTYETVFIRKADFIEPTHHYDWWMFPLQARSDWSETALKYSVSTDETKMLLKNKDFMNIYVDGIQRYLNALKKSGWNNYSIRYAKMTLSLAQFMNVSNQMESTPDLDARKKQLLALAQEAVQFQQKSFPNDKLHLLKEGVAKLKQLTTSQQNQNRPCQR